MSKSEHKYNAVELVQSNTFSIYIDEYHIVSVDVTAFEFDTIYLNRIFVPRQFRFQGYGTRALENLISKCDENRITIILDINPYDDALTYEQLKEWYLRHGFEFDKGIYRRKPKED